jgi:small subunit ribosomal protein S8
MVMTDPIADMLTRIRNANRMRHLEVQMPNSKVKQEVLNVLVQEGYINGYEVVKDGVQGFIKVALKYTNSNERVIKGLKRISKPGLRVYAKVEDLPRVLNGLGIALISTSKGIMTDKQARLNQVGGEVLAYVW